MKNVIAILCILMSSMSLAYQGTTYNPGYDIGNQVLAEEGMRNQDRIQDRLDGYRH